MTGRRIMSAILGVLAIASCSHSNTKANHTPSLSTTSTIAKVTPGDALTIREVLETLPYRGAPGSTCAGGARVTARAKQTASANIMLADRQKLSCYSLGPTILTGHDIATARAVVSDQTGEWIVDVHFANNDFLDKVAGPYANREIGIVLDGIVQSAPRINPGITSRDVTISSEYDEATAQHVAASIAP